MGFDLHSKTVGVIGTGNIGQAFINIMLGFDCKVIAYDVVHNEQCIQSGVTYVCLDNLLSHADVISLHCPLTPDTYHLIDQQALVKLRDDVTIINTSRGKLVDTKAIINVLKTSKVGVLGLDVYEDEAIFFEDYSAQAIQDDLLARLITFPDVIITSHQCFFTQEAMLNIAQTTLSNISQFEQNGSIQNSVV
jgi:D-lactate dehydrogenase